jgi:hypothetical protein
MLIKNATVVNVQNDATERAIFLLGQTFGFNFLVRFDGLSYVFLGNFSPLQAYPIIWRLSKLLELLDARIAAIPTRVEAGLATDKATEAVNFFIKRLAIWLIVAGATEADEIKAWAKGKTLPVTLEIFTLAEVNDTVTQLPGFG